MKKLDFPGLSALLLWFLAPAPAHSQDIEWEKSYGGKHAEYLMDAQPTPDYGFILAGSSLSKRTGNKTEASRGDLDYWIWKMDENGDLDWQKSFGGSGSDFLQSIRLAPDGGYILGGTSASGNGLDKKDGSRGGSDYWIIKLDAMGGEEWQRTLGGEGQDDLLCVIPCRDGGYLAAGSSSSGAGGGKTAGQSGNMDYWVLKLDSRGRVQWQQSYGGLYADLLRAAEATPDGGFILGGYSNSPQGGSKSIGGYGEGDYWIIKIDASGAIEWQQAFGGDKDDQLYALRQTAGGYMAAGSSNSGATGNKSSSSRNGTDFWVLQLDAQGSILWQETYDFGKYDILTSLAESGDGGFLIGGHAQSEGRKAKDPESVNDYIALKISASGEKLWEKAAGSSGEDILKKAIAARGGGYLMAGTSEGRASRDKKSGIGNKDFWVVKLSDSGRKKEDRKPIEAFPNPTARFSNVVVGYDFKTGTATVYDLGGRQLQHFEIQDRTVPVDLGGYPEGIYLVEISTDVQKDAVKIAKTANRN
ncbi:MAG TPA: T9SS type A sorting domain-containing protein [Flavobacterium sp.]|nr:T9SS type A sorting domain-containing protein [Flavobacterium sp.]